MRYFTRIGGRQYDVSGAHLDIKKFGVKFLNPRYNKLAAQQRGEPGDENPTGYCFIPMQIFSEYPALDDLCKQVLQIIPKDERVLACFVRRMPPHSHIKAHRDGLAPARRRYQMVIEAGPEAKFTIETEGAYFKPGELWLCDIGNNWHRVDNDSRRPRIVLIIDTIYDASFGPTGNMDTADDEHSLSGVGKHVPTESCCKRCEQLRGGYPIATEPTAAEIASFG